MKRILKRIRREPVLVTAFVTALLGLLVAFGLDLSPKQIAAILAFVGSALAFVARSKVTPVRKHR